MRLGLGFRNQLDLMANYVWPWLLYKSCFNAVQSTVPWAQSAPVGVQCFLSSPPSSTCRDPSPSCWECGFLLRTIPWCRPTILCTVFLSSSLPTSSQTSPPSPAYCPSSCIMCPNRFSFCSVRLLFLVGLWLPGKKKQGVSGVRCKWDESIDNYCCGRVCRPRLF